MANRAEIAKLLQEIRGYAEVTNRRPPPGADGALWVPNRPQPVHVPSPRRRLSVKVDMREAEDSGQLVKIRHLPGSQASPASDA